MREDLGEIRAVFEIRCTVDLRVWLAPLTERLTNLQFRSDLDKIWDKAALGSSNPGEIATSAPSCRCGCGQYVSPGRKFASQHHYDAWRAQRRLNTKKRLGLQVALERVSRSAYMNELRGYGATLASLMAMTIANVGDVRQARRWRRSARQLAEQSGDTSKILWIRGREVVRALYEARPTPVILQMIEEAETFAGGASPTDLAELMSGKAQTLALAGRRGEAEAALHEVRGIYDSLPADALSNRDSIYGWPENRLRFTESYIYTYLGDAAEATAAQDRAVELYSGSYRRGPAQIELQRALWMVSSGDVTTGVAHASAAMQSLPSQDQIRPIVALAKSVLGAVPGSQMSKPVVGELRECLALTAAV